MPTLVQSAIVAVALTVNLAQCGRKGALEVPGEPGATVSGTEAQIAASRGLEPTARAGDTVVESPGAAPALRGARGAAAADLRAADIRGANADAPEPGDAIPEGPTTAAPERRGFLLDPLL